MTDDYILHAHFLEHISGNFTGECATLLEVAVLSADLDIGTLGQLQCGFQIGVRNANDYTAGLVSSNGLECVDQLSSLCSVLVHLPVTGNNCLSQCFIHDDYDS